MEAEADPAVFREHVADHEESPLHVDRDDLHAGVTGKEGAREAAPAAEEREAQPEGRPAHGGVGRLLVQREEALDRRREDVAAEAERHRENVPGQGCCES